MYALKFTTSLLSFALIFLCANPAQGQIQQIHEELQRLTLSKDSISLVNSLNRLGTLYRTRNADSCFYYGMKAKRTATNIQYRKGQTDADHVRSEEHTSELQSLMRISYAVFCLKQKKQPIK